MTKKGRAKLAIWAALIVIVLIVMFQNTDLVPFRVLFWKPTAPTVIWLLISFVAGAGAGVLTAKYLSTGKARGPQA